MILSFHYSQPIVCTLYAHVKFEIDINNNEILKIKWEHDKEKKSLNVTGSVQQHGAQVQII
jgi:hypothetical protein